MPTSLLVTRPGQQEGRQPGGFYVEDEWETIGSLWITLLKYIRKIATLCCTLVISDLHELKNLLIDAEEKHFPDSELMQSLNNAVTEAMKCANVANQLVSKKVRTRYTGN